MSAFALLVGLVAAGLLIPADAIQFTQYWSGTGDEGKRTAIAFKTDASITECTWRKGSIQVDTKSFGNRKAVLSSPNICILRFDKVTSSDDGEWEATAFGLCSSGFNRGKRQAPDPLSNASVTFSDGNPLKRSPIANLIGSTSSGSSVVDDAVVSFNRNFGDQERQERTGCSVTLRKVLLRVTRTGRLEAIAAQSEFHPKPRDILSTRVNALPDSCTVSHYDTQTRTYRTVINKDFLRIGNREECVTYLSNSVCLFRHESTTDGVFGCQLRFNQPDRNVEGRYKVEVTLGRETASAEFNVDLPQESGQIVQGRPQLSGATSATLATICTSARSGDRFSFSVAFTSDPAYTTLSWRMRRRELVREGQTGGVFRAYRAEEDRVVRNKFTAKMEIERLENSDLNDRNAHTLEVTNSYGTSIFYILLDSSSDCRNSQDASTYTCDVTRDSNCFCRTNNVDCCDGSPSCRNDCCESCSAQAQSIGQCTYCDYRNSNCKKKGGYQCDTRNADCRCWSGYCCDFSSRCTGPDCCKDCYREEGDCRCDTSGRNCVILGPTNQEHSTYTCNPSLDRDCVCHGSFCCTFSTRCQGQECCVSCNSGTQNCMCDSRGSNCVIVSSNSDSCGTNGKATRGLLKSCLSLGASTLQLVTPAGERRETIQQTESQFKSDVRRFFEDVRCAGFDRDVESAYQGTSYNEPFTSGVGFKSGGAAGLGSISNLSGGKKAQPSTVVQTSSSIEEQKLKDTLAIAKQIVEGQNAN